MNRALNWVAASVAFVAVLSGCGTGPGAGQADLGERNLIVTTSTIVEDIVQNIVGDGVEVLSVIPNGFDSHTYEPKPSEIELLAEADLIVMADKNLNQKITQLAELSGKKERILDLNEASLAVEDFIIKPTSSRANPHTWTDPNLVAKWVPVLLGELVVRGLATEGEAGVNAKNYLEELAELDAAIAAKFSSTGADQRRLVVYHDAWEYFARRYGFELVGVLQAVDFAEPSAAEIAELSAQIKELKVPAFFGSEVFPSDVLEVLERESGATYISDLADDKLPGQPGEEGYGYIPLMRQNLELLAQGLLR
jgi:ABC-type Zn uptake system ZnuABC Zn-binding protein ZnuA